MATFQKQETAVFIKAQGGKGTAATVATGDAVEVTQGTSLVKPVGNVVERTILRPGTRLGAKKLVIGTWGDGEIECELHSGTSATTAPEYGLLVKNLLGAETVGTNSVTYGIALAGDTSWLTVDQFEDGARYLASDARCRMWQVTANANEIIMQKFGVKSLSCAYSAETNATTQTLDSRPPMVGTNCTFTIGGGSKNALGIEFTVENPKTYAYINNAGLGDLPEDSTLTVSGSMKIEYTDVSPLTAFFNTTTQDIILTATDGTQTATITLEDCQYDQPVAEEADGDLNWSIPFVATGGVTLKFQ